MIDLGPLACHLLALARRPGEQSGLLLGSRRGGVVLAAAFYPTRNLAGAPDRFLADPWDIVVAHEAADNMGLEVVAVFHTHPCGAAAPSALDVEGMKRWPLIWVIASPAGIRAWRPGGPSEVPVSAWCARGGVGSRSSGQPA